MLATGLAAQKFPGTVPALMAGVQGDTERIGAMVTNFCAEAPGRVRALVRAVIAGDASAVRQEAHSLYGILAPFGVPQLRTAAATLEDLGRAKDLGPAVPLVDELEAGLGALCAYLARKPWFRF